MSDQTNDGGFPVPPHLSPIIKRWLAEQSESGITNTESTEADPITPPRTLTRQMVLDARNQLRQAAARITADQIREVFKMPPMPWLGGDLQRFRATARHAGWVIDYAQAEARVLAAMADPAATPYTAEKYDVGYDDRGHAWFYVSGVAQDADDFMELVNYDSTLTSGEKLTLQGHVDCHHKRTLFPGNTEGTVTGRSPTQQQNVPKGNAPAEPRSTQDRMKYWLTDDTVTPAPKDSPIVTGVDLELDDGDTPVDHGKELIKENLLDPARQAGPSDTVKRFLKAFPDD